MTVIVGVRKGDKAVIGADSQTNDGNLVVPRDAYFNTEKIQKIGSSYIATAGSAANRHVLASVYLRHPELFDLGSEQAIFETFRRLQKVLEDEYFTNTSERDNQDYASNQLYGMICNESGIYHFQSNREIDAIRKFWAEGSGSDIALGALAVLYDRLDDPEDIARQAVEIACRYDDGCGLPAQTQAVRYEPSVAG